MRKFLIITRNYVIIMRKYLIREIMAKWLESWTRNRKVASLNLGLAGIAGGGSECTASEQGTEPPTAPGLRSINGCPLLCVHFGWVNAEHEFRVWVTILGHMSRHFNFYIFYQGGGNRLP